MNGLENEHQTGAHPDEEELLALVLAHDAGGTDDTLREHLRDCRRCRDIQHQWFAIVDATRAEEDTPIVAAYEDLIAPALAAITPPAATAVNNRIGLRRSIRMVARVTARQASLVPRLLAPATLGVLLLAAVAQAQWPQGGHTMLSRVIELVMVICVLSGMAPANDPRSELGWTLPVSPRLVVLCRLLLVLGLATVGALAATGTLTAVEQDIGGFGPVLVGWLGPSLLSAACTSVALLRRGRAAAALVGFTTWALAPMLVHRLPPITGTVIAAALALALLTAAFIRLNRWVALATT
ncbi:MAG: hypothetical protein QG608_1615 [Actinomycetota bacterium]|nr:hypothetical protein [Actinomycetota bacterium]